MLKPLCACAVAESILTRPRTKKAWSLKIGGNDIVLARWSSHQPVRNGMRAVLRTRTQTAMFTCGVVRGVQYPFKCSRTEEAFIALRAQPETQ